MNIMKIEKIKENIYRSPILFEKCDIKSDTEILPRVFLKTITKNEREQFFGLSEIEYSFHKKYPYISSIRKRKKQCRDGRFDFDKTFIFTLFNRTEAFYCSNYYLEFKVSHSKLTKITQNLNLSFKLLRLTSTGIFIAFDNKNGYHICHPITIGGPFPYLSIKEKDIKDLNNIYNSINKFENKKFNICMNLFSDSLRGGYGIQSYIRFLQLIVILEILYLPGIHEELKYRLSLGLSKMIFQTATKRAETFKFITEIYNLRSKIIHEGKYNEYKINALFPELCNLVRLSLLKYLNTPNDFEQDTLMKMILN